MKRIVILLMVLFISGCDHTDLLGDISVTEYNDVYVLHLTVPEDLEDIHNVMWSSNPSGCSIVSEGDEVIDYLDEIGYSYDEPYDRYAVVVLVEEVCTIEAYGFFKQTNPQPIAEVKLPNN